MPISRFLEYLIETDNLDEYMSKLVMSFNASTIAGLMCKNTLSIGWDGKLYDCDFNQMLDLSLNQSAPQNIKDFSFKNIETGIQYLHIKHFLADRIKMQKSKEFYDSIKNLLTEPNLILDLRNNDGGANKVSKKFLKLIKKYTKNGQVYILINNGTLSQGEIFTLQLKRLKNVKTLGQTTKGMLTYGSNYGVRRKLPSQSFEVYITDMRGKGAKKLMPYENYGVSPDIILNNTKDWIEQTLEIIRKN